MSWYYEERRRREAEEKEKKRLEEIEKRNLKKMKIIKKLKYKFKLSNGNIAYANSREDMEEILLDDTEIVSQEENK